MTIPEFDPAKIALSRPMTPCSLHGLTSLDALLALRRGDTNRCALILQHVAKLSECKCG